MTQRDAIDVLEAKESVRVRTVEGCASHVPLEVWPKKVKIEDFLWIGSRAVSC